MVVWLNRGESLVLNAASLVPRRVGEEKGRAAEATTPGIAIDWLDVEGPLIDAWPTAAHKRLFGDLPLVLFDKKSDLKPPPRIPQGQRPPAKLPNYKVDHPNQPIWTVASTAPEQDAEKLLRNFLPRAFRHPVTAQELARYVGLVRERLAAKVTFEEAMRTAYQAALCSPDFLFLKEPRGPLDDHANWLPRLSLFLVEFRARCRARPARRSGRVARPRNSASANRTDAARLEGRTLHRGLHRPMARPARPRPHQPGQKALPRVPPDLARCHARRDTGVLPRNARARPAGAECCPQQFRHAQPAPRRTLWNRGRERRRDSQGAAGGGRAPWRLARAGGRAESHRQWHDHLAGEARSVGRCE